MTSLFSSTLQAVKSAVGICPEVAKRGDVSRCPYNDKCRFSHDIEAYKAQVLKIGFECLCSVFEFLAVGFSCK